MMALELKIWRWDVTLEPQHGVDDPALLLVAQVRAHRQAERLAAIASASGRSPGAMPRLGYASCRCGGTG